MTSDTCALDTSCCFIALTWRAYGGVSDIRWMEPGNRLSIGCPLFPFFMARHSLSNLALKVLITYVFRKHETLTQCCIIVGTASKIYRDPGKTSSGLNYPYLFILKPKLKNLLILILQIFANLDVKTPLHSHWNTPLHYLRCPSTKF